MKTIYKIYWFTLFFCFTLYSIAQTLDLSNSREALKVNEMGLNNFELYYTGILNIYGYTLRNPTVEEETNGLINYSNRLRNQGILKEEWRNYPVHFHSIQLEEKLQSRGLSGADPELSKAIAGGIKSYFKNELGFLQLQNNHSLTTLQTDVLKSILFRPETVNEASQLFGKNTFNNIIKDHTTSSGIHVISFFFKQLRHYTNTFHISTYVYFNNILMFTTTLNINTSFEYIHDDDEFIELFDITKIKDEKYLTLIVNTLFESIQKY